MEKNIKDYLHLYLGCEVDMLLYYTCPATHKVITMSHSVYDDLMTGLDRTISVPVVKPILRPLSDMTEEEAKELLEGANCEYQNIILPNQNKQRELIITGTKKMYRVRLDVLAPETMRFLLSKHFDLFGLIEAGLAIDKTKLTTL